MSRAVRLSLLVLPACLLLLSCGSSSNNSTVTQPKFRALVSQDINGGGITAGLQVIDAQKDVRAIVAPISAGATPGMMLETPNLNLTLAFSPTGNSLSLVSNSSESVSATVALPGPTESIAISPDSIFAYVAVPTASPGLGQPPGVVEVISLSSGNVIAQLAVPAARYVSMGNTGNRVLAFGDDNDSLAVITPSNIGTGDPVVAFVGGFDRPVAAFLTLDDNNAFVVNCGPECGGTQASVQAVDLTTDTAGTAVSLPAASIGLLNGTTLYLAGSYVNPSAVDPCPEQTVFSTTCGSLSIVELPGMTVTNSGIAIGNGDHKRIAMGADGQLFVGARDCSEVSGVSGCLSIYSTTTGAVVITHSNGDVTGIQPIANRHVVYVVQGGELQIYDTTTDKLQTQQINIIGQAVDVKTIDF